MINIINLIFKITGIFLIIKKFFYQKNTLKIIFKCLLKLLSTIKIIKKFKINKISDLKNIL